MTCKFKIGDKVIALNTNDNLDYVDCDFKLGDHYVICAVQSYPMNCGHVKLLGLPHWYEAWLFEHLEVRREEIIKSILE